MKYLKYYDKFIIKENSNNVNLLEEIENLFLEFIDYDYEVSITEGYYLNSCFCELPLLGKPNKAYQVIIKSSDNQKGGDMNDNLKRAIDYISIYNLSLVKIYSANNTEIKLSDLDINNGLIFKTSIKNHKYEFNSIELLFKSSDFVEITMEDIKNKLTNLRSKREEDGLIYSTWSISNIIIHYVRSSDIKNTLKYASQGDYTKTSNAIQVFDSKLSNDNKIKLIDKIIKSYSNLNDLSNVINKKIKTYDEAFKYIENNPKCVENIDIVDDIVDLYIKIESDAIYDKYREDLIKEFDSNLEKYFTFKRFIDEIDGEFMYKIFYDNDLLLNYIENMKSEDEELDLEISLDELIENMLEVSDYMSFETTKPTYDDVYMFIDDEFNNKVLSDYLK